MVIQRAALRLMHEAFRRYFDEPAIRLPDLLTVGEPGRIDFAGSGWTISFRLDGDAHTGYRLDFYASHRLTNSRHARILQNGELLPLENFWEFGYAVYDDDPERTVQEKLEIDARNEKVAAILKKKGLLF